jgi:hypothetical protein
MCQRGEGEGEGRSFFKRLELAGPNFLIQHLIVSMLTSIPRTARRPKLKQK